MCIGFIIDSNAHTRERNEATTKTFILHENEISECLAAIKCKTCHATRECGLKISVCFSIETCYRNEHEKKTKKRTHAPQSIAVVSNGERLTCGCLWISTAWMLVYGLKANHCLLMFDGCAHFLLCLSVCFSYGWP